MSPDDPTLIRPADPASTATLGAIPDSAGTLPELPGYQIEAEIGRGAMGVVYRARQVNANRPVAVKVILSGAHTGEAARRRFQAEAEAVARLDHPNVIRVFDVGEAGETPTSLSNSVPAATWARSSTARPGPAAPPPRPSPP